MRDKYYPQDVYNDPYCRFLVLETLILARLCGWWGFMPLTKPLNILHYGAHSFRPHVWAVQDYLWVILTCRLMHLNLRQNIQSWMILSNVLGIHWLWMF